MRANPLPLIGGFYADETRPWSQQDICNYLPVAAESDGTRTPTMAKTPPGLSPFARISGDPSRGVYSAEDRLFTVMGNTLYQVTPTDAILLGSISGSSRVRFAHNQITGGNQVLIVNGSAGWVWNTNTSTLTLITDTGYPGAINARFIDGYLVQIEPARRFAFHSDLADALSYNTLDRFTSEVSPDLLVSMAVSNNELILFSERTAEFFENTGATQQPFRSKRISFNRGCAGRFAAIEMDNSVFWLGDDGSFYRLDGYTPLRISTRPIEQAIRGLNWDGAFAFVWKDSGHSVCYWTFPGGLTFGFDASQGKWHRRASYGFGRWRVQDMTYWQNRWIASDLQKGRLWSLEWDYPWEFDQEFVSELTSPVIHDNQSRVLMPRLEIVMDTGMPEVAVRPFEIDVAPLSISGDVPNGTVGDPISGNYVVTGGVPTIGPVSISSGTFPTGLTLNANGAYSGTLTASGNYSWVVQVIDGDGNVANTPDSADIAGYQSIVLGDAPLYYYRLDEPSGSTVNDVSGMSPQLNATLINNPTHGTPGLIPGDPDTAMTFNGTNQEINQNWASRLDTPQYTIECIFQPSTVSGGVRHICNRDRGVTTQRVFQLRQNDTSAEFTTFDTVPTSYGLTSAGFFSVGQKVLIHVRVNTTTGACDMWKNGIMVDSDDFPPLASIANYGHNWAGPDGFLSGGQAAGVLDELAFYGSILSPERILLRAQFLGLA